MFKFGLGHRVKVNKPGDPWHNCIGNITSQERSPGKTSAVVNFPVDPFDRKARFSESCLETAEVMTQKPGAHG